METFLSYLISFLNKMTEVLVKLLEGDSRSPRQSTRETFSTPTRERKAEMFPKESLHARLNRFYGELDAQINKCLEKFGLNTSESSFLEFEKVGKKDFFKHLTKILNSADKPLKEKKEEVLNFLSSYGQILSIPDCSFEEIDLKDFKPSWLPRYVRNILYDDMKLREDELAESPANALRMAVKYLYESGIKSAVEDIKTVAMLLEMAEDEEKIKKRLEELREICEDEIKAD